MELVIIIFSVPLFVLYTIGVFCIGHYRGYASCFNDAKMLFLANETEESEDKE